MLDNLVVTGIVAAAGTVRHSQAVVNCGKEASPHFEKIGAEFEEVSSIGPIGDHPWGIEQFEDYETGSVFKMTGKITFHLFHVASRTFR
jgi:hypothetical protein